MDQALRIERVVLLGLVTLLGATVDLVTGLAALVATVLAATLVWVVAAGLRLITGISEPGRWGLLIAAGFAVSWMVGTVVPFMAPIRESALLFVRIAGLMPIVYYSLAEGVSRGDRVVSLLEFGVLVVAIAAVREFFGRGTLLGYLPAGSFVTRAGFLASPIGAFLLLGGVVLGARIVSRLGASPDGTAEERG